MDYLAPHGRNAKREFSSFGYEANFYLPLKKTSACWGRPEVTGSFPKRRF
jgi:hypothetical protein